MSNDDDPAGSGRRLPAGVWALGMVSLLMDLSSETIHALLPLFLVGGLGAGALALGLIEGAAEATAQIVKIFSGAFSDWIGRRKPVTLAGYGLAALTKPLFPLASSVATVFLARFADRIGKGIRGAPRDALVAELVDPGQRGAAYGLRQTLDTVGAFLGPVAAIGLMALFADDIRSVFWVAVIPAIAAVLVLIFAVHEPGHAVPRHARGSPIAWGAVPAMGAAFWGVVSVGVLFSLARFSEAFLILRADSAGMSITLVPVVMVVMNLVYALSAYPAGALSDRLGRAGLLVTGFLVLVLADLVLGFAGSVAGVLAGAGLWGLHMGLTQGVLASLVADTAPARLRATGFGIFNLAGGLALFAASAIAGLLWQTTGPAATFLAGAAFAAIAMVAFLVLGLKLHRRPRPGRLEDTD